MKSFEKRVKVLTNRKICGNYFELSFIDKDISGCAAPGQFLMLKTAAGFSPLLRRPFSIHSCRGNSIKVLYEVKGPGSELVSRFRKGDNFEVVGPLGNGFPLPDKNSNGVILVAGGMGVAPLVFLAQRLRNCGIRSLRAFIGASGKECVLCEKEFSVPGFKVAVSTDDGSRGKKGYVSLLLEEYLRGKQTQGTLLYCCGPRPMLRAVAAVAAKYSISGYCSLEAHMACGIGACMGCVIPVQNSLMQPSYKRVCKDGPVFPLQEVVWEGI